VARGIYIKTERGKDPPIKKQNESADIMAKSGYKTEMLPTDTNPSGHGNGYGISADTNPDYLIEGKPADCYSPNGSDITIIDRIGDKAKKQAENIVLNLDRYEGDIEILLEKIISEARENGKLHRLANLFVIKDGKIILIWGE
jgi:hypothetical protein